ncbi:MAG: bifunctional diaminohydroxyphosphoribosylaminopyrimidine deaminase/5-amino-6-(5-phosphoribosylamino)uracil reductase RibD [Gammaproteobacteria bacterium]|nr:MAG: bifunctional diaminohydroxyphosphoribosylaminopyrimidine deaminase/5-amino-6-(5-phosphoribosylamino)uracil reductase RibD [Gammaproteobacteria bacterium]
MLQAIKLAKNGKYSVKSNPIVGCIIVKNNQIIGRGYHQKAGTAHAEINALNQASAKTEGADVYISLEPCCHLGKTPACTDSLIRAKIKRVFFATKDPNSLVAGGGMRALNQAGIETKVGILKNKALRLNPNFSHRMKTGTPIITLKIAMSLDGKIALNNGDSQWISSKKSRDDSHKMRALSDTILTTSNTIIADNPRMNARVKTKKKITQPTKIVIDKTGRLNYTYQFFNTDTKIIIITQNKNYLNPPTDNIHILIVADFSLKNIFKSLECFEYNSIFIECGPRFATALIKEKICDQLVLYLSPKILGEDSMSIFKNKITKISDAPKLTIKKIKRIGQDIKLTLEL